MPQMQDTGERITYEDGAQREPHQGKGRYDWISPFGWERLRVVGGDVCGPMGRDDLQSYELKEIESANVMINQWRMGHREIDFLAYAAWRVAAVIYHQETGKPCPLGTEHSPNPYALKRLADWYEAGGIKYAERGERNWEKGMPYDHPLDSCLRHINKWRMGMTDEDHLAAAVWNLFALMHYEACHMDRFDNIPRYQEARGLPETVVMNPEKSR